MFFIFELGVRTERTSKARNAAY